MRKIADSSSPRLSRRSGALLRRLGAVALAATIALPAMTGSALAYSVQTSAPAYVVTSSPATAVIAFDSIPAMVDQNLALQQAKNTANSTYGSRSDLITQLTEAQTTLDGYAETYQDAVSTINDLHETGIIGDDERDFLVENARSLYDTMKASTESSITSLQQGINSAEYAERNASLAVVSTRQQQIDTAQQAFFNYYSLRHKKVSAQNQLKNLEFQIELAEIKVARKLMSQVAYDQLISSLPTARLGIESIDMALRQNELALKSALGLSAATAIEYGPLPVMDLSVIPARVRDVDRQTYLARNSVIEQARLGIQKADADLATEVTDKLYDHKGAVLTYEQAVEAATIQFEAAYDSLQDKYRSWQNAEKSHADLAKELRRLESKYKAGKASKNSVRNKQDELTQSQNNLQAQKIDLYSQYQAYLNGLTL